MRTIVVGFGAHAHSTRALEWAARLARRSDAKILVVNVFHPAYAEMSHDSHQDRIESRRRRIEEVMENLGQDDVEVIIREGEAVEELLRFSREAEADLIVVGHHDSMAPWGFGERGAAEILLRESEAPFVVVGETAPLPPEKEQLTMIVGLDGSPSNADSIAAVAAIAKDLDARAVPVYAVNTGASTTRDHYGSRLVNEDDASVIAACLPGDEPLRTVNEMPIAGLTDVARDDDADLIAIGTRGHRSLFDLFAGQFARHLIDNADRAVLVVPHH